MYTFIKTKSSLNHIFIMINLRYVSQQLSRTHAAITTPQDASKIRITLFNLKVFLFSLSNIKSGLICNSKTI